MGKKKLIDNNTTENPKEAPKPDIIMNNPNALERILKSVVVSIKKSLKY
jgi:hypothetical protein